LNITDHVEIIRKFNRFYANVLGKMDQEIYTGQYPLTEAQVMTEINSKNGCNATEVSEKLGIDRGYLSRIIQQFQEEKIVIKKQSSHDKRQYLLYITEDGKTVLDGLIETANREVRRMVESIPYKDKNTLVRSMESIEAIISGENKSDFHVSIRSFRPGDVGYVAYLHGNLYEKIYGFSRTFEYYVMKGLTEFLEDSEGGDLWIAEVNGDIVGSIAITKSSEKIAQLRWFVIDERYQGFGIGKKLMNAALEFCENQGYQTVFLWTVNILETARYLYSKYNFTLTDEKPNNLWTDTELMEERWELTL
jgi:DNA-binding MarR family transcriptional regulator/N-acetylglutamate synthase-like GNAT family acetyltransferase